MTWERMSRHGRVRAASRLRWLAGVLALGGSLANGTAAEEASIWLPQSFSSDPEHPGQAEVTGLLKMQLLLERLRQQLPALSNRLSPGGRVELALDKLEFAKIAPHEVQLRGMAYARAELPDTGVEVSASPICIKARVRVQAAGTAMQVELRLDEWNLSPVRDRSLGTWTLPLAAVKGLEDTELIDVDVRNVVGDRVTLGAIIRQRATAAGTPRAAETPTPTAAQEQGASALPLQATTAPATPAEPPPRVDLQPAPPVTPPPNGPPTLAEPPASQIDLSITMPLETLRQFAESQVPRVREEAPYNVHVNGGADNVGQGVSLGYWVRRSPLALSMQGRVLRVSAEVEYWVQARARQRILFARPIIHGSCGTNGEPPRRAAIGLETTLTLRPDWTLDASTRPAPVVPIDRCRVTIFNFDVTDKAVGAMQRILDGFAGRLDERIEAALSVRERAERAWRQIAQPLRLDNGVWLDLRPQAIAVSPLSAQGGQIVLGIHMEARPRVLAGEAPATTAPALPGLGHQSTGEGFHVVVPVELTYEEATRRLREALGLPDRPLRYPPGDAPLIEIKDVEVSAAGDQVVIRAALGGNASGWVYLAGKPYYDVLTQTLLFPTLDYTVETQGVLPRPEAGFPPAPLRDGVRASAKIALADRISEWRSRLELVLNRQVDTLALSGAIDSLEFIGVTTDSARRRFLLQLRMSGRVTAAVHSLEQHLRAPTH